METYAVNENRLNEELKVEQENIQEIEKLEEALSRKSKPIVNDDDEKEAKPEAKQEEDDDDEIKIEKNNNGGKEPSQNGEVTASKILEEEEEEGSLGGLRNDFIMKTKGKIYFKKKVRERLHSLYLETIEKRFLLGSVFFVENDVCHFGWNEAADELFQIRRRHLGDVQIECGFTFCATNQALQDEISSEQVSI